MVLADHITNYKATVCRVIQKVSTQIGLLHSTFITFLNNAAKRQKIQSGFYRMHQFLRVIGAIDCTHIKVQSPYSDIGEQFHNRKGNFFLNVQAICDSNLKILSIAAK